MRCGGWSVRFRASGPKTRLLQPVISGKVAFASFSGLSPGSSQLEALTPTSSGTPQRVGLVRKGSSLPPGGREGEETQWELRTSSGVQRSGSCSGAAGTPQRVDSSITTAAAAGALVTSAVIP